MRNLLLPLVLIVGVSAAPDEGPEWEDLKEGSWVEQKSTVVQDGKAVYESTEKSTFVRREQVRIGGKTVTCAVVETERSDGIKITTWYSPDVPGRMVRMTSDHEGAKQTTECTGFETRR